MFKKTVYCGEQKHIRPAILNFQYLAFKQTVQFNKSYFGTRATCSVLVTLFRWKCPERISGS